MKKLLILALLVSASFVVMPASAAFDTGIAANVAHVAQNQYQTPINVAIGGIAAQAAIQREASVVVQRLNNIVI